MTTPAVRRIRWVFAGALLLIAAGLYWLASPEGGEPSCVQGRTEVPAETDGEEAALRAPTADSDRDRDVVPPPAREAADPDGSNPAPDLAPGASHVGFLGMFVRADRVQIAPAHATVVLMAENGATFEAETRDEEKAYVGDVPPGRYTVRVDAEGYRHRPQEFDLTRPQDFVSGRNDFTLRAEPFASERLYLWPERWLAVVVETPDGRPFAALAEDHGWEPKQLFVGAFEARACAEGPGPDAWDTSSPTEFATWRQPSGHHQWSLPGNCVGSLELSFPPPLWVGLRLHGESLGWELVQPGETSVLFRLDAATLTERLARLALRVVDAKSGVPLPGAVVVLRADVSAHRRDDHLDVPTPADGRVVLERIVPGEYELSITHAEAIHQDRLVLGTGEDRDLGDIALGRGRRIEVRVVLPDGEPAGAWVEIGPYRRGERVDRLYPPMLSRMSNERGVCWLPMPTGPSIVRATVYSPRRHYPTDRQSANVLVDPASPPSGPLPLEVQDPVEVLFDVGLPAGAEIRLLDANGLVVEVAPIEGTATPRVELIPGRYEVVLLDAAAKELARKKLRMGDLPVRLALP